MLNFTNLKYKYIQGGCMESQFRANIKQPNNKKRKVDARKDEQIIKVCQKKNLESPDNQS